jgi:signal transduction histidine kinase
MLIIERLIYFLVLMPLLADCLLARGLSLTPPAVAVALAQGSIILSVGLLVRRSRKLNERLESLRDMMNEAVIHDLKNPMTSIMGCLSYALENETEADRRRALRAGKPAPSSADECVACAHTEEMDAAQRRKLLALAQHGCKDQLALLETLVDSTRFENGEVSIRKQSIDTAKLLDDCLDGVRVTASHMQIKLEEDIGQSFPASIRVDPELFPRVFSNLLNNALKYTHSGGTVTLRAGVDRGNLRFEVQDTGVGISAEHINRLFGKYYRVEGGDQSSRRGSGLGLYFCRMIVEAHGGTIRVTSSPGVGTSIIFDLPAGN